jgi:26S proteasome regulatory subunit N2
LAYQIAFSLFENDIQPFLNTVNDILAAESETGGEVLGKLRSILSGELPFALYLEFLYSHNHADLLLLKQVKTAVESRNSVCHSACVLANAMTHAGTACDQFLRDNLDWLSRATNWARFSATAGVGVIHRGRTKDSRQLLSQLLPAPSPYTLGGALYAMGLIHTGQPGEALPFLLERARGNNNEVIQHGACLGMGLAAVGTGNPQVDAELFRILRTDSAVAGEAAGIGLGLLYAGTATPRAQEMHQYCTKTSHGKIVRGCSLGMALTLYGREEGGDTLIESMIHDGDKIMRYGGCLAAASAYAGTGNNNALRKLLHMAVSDVSDDVRRAAVMSLGFVLCSTPEQCPRVVALLAESYNPHVRYGSAMAVGIACAGTGLAEAIALLEPMMNDQVDFVQQGALIAMAMVRVQQNEKQLAGFRKKVMGHIQEPHETTMCKMGAIMAQGILDAGGRNVTIGLRSRTGRPRMTSVLGMLVFTQYWYWYPLSYFISLTFVPTAFIAVDSTLAMPHCSVTSHAKPSTFAYLAPVTEDDKKNMSKVTKAVLSTTAKANAKRTAKMGAPRRLKGAELLAAVSNMDSIPVPAAVGMQVDASPAENKPEDAMDVEKKEPAEGEEEKKEEKPEPLHEELTNPSRVTVAQEKAIRFDSESRFVPIAASGTTKFPARGLIVLRDTTPGEEVAYVELQFKPQAPPQAVVAVDQDEPAPPDDFEFNPDDDDRGY